jgi:hypothetical protein
VKTFKFRTYILFIFFYIIGGVTGWKATSADVAQPAETVTTEETAAIRIPEFYLMLHRNSEMEFQREGNFTILTEHGTAWVTITSTHTFTVNGESAQPYGDANDPYFRLVHSSNEPIHVMGDYLFIWIETFDEPATVAVTKE